MTRSLVALAAAALLAGCSQTGAQRMLQPRAAAAANPAATMIERNYQAADAMAKALEGKLSVRDGIAVTDFTNTNAPEERSALGRVVPEQISSRMAQLGLRPVSIRHGKGPEQGGDMTAEAILVGDYTVAADVIFVNARIVGILDAKVLAGFDYALPAGANARSLLPGQPQAKGYDPSVNTLLSAARR